MTKIKSPATRGIVARLEEALGPLRASVTESLDGVARRLLRETKNLRSERDELIEKRHVEIERVERLKAENASLLESLREAEQLAESRGRMLSDSLALHEQANQHLFAAEQRNTALMPLVQAAERLRDQLEKYNTLPDYDLAFALEAADEVAEARAALHDEERRQTMEVTREVVKEALGENRPQVLDRAGEQGAEPGARTGAHRLVDAARDRPPDQVLEGSGRGVPEKVLDERAAGLDEERSAALAVHEAPEFLTHGQQVTIQIPDPAVRLAERVRLLEGALGEIERRASVGPPSPPGRKAPRNQWYDLLVWVGLHARAVLASHDEERSAPPPTEEK